MSRTPREPFRASTRGLCVFVSRRRRAFVSVVARRRRQARCVAPHEARRSLKPPGGATHRGCEATRLESDGFVVTRSALKKRRRRTNDNRQRTTDRLVSLRSLCSPRLKTLSLLSLSPRLKTARSASQGRERGREATGGGGRENFSEGAFRPPRGGAWAHETPIFIG